MLPAGQNLVSEQEDEAETGDAGLLRRRRPSGDVPAAAPGPVPPRHGHPAAPPPGGATGLLPAERRADGPSAAPSPPDTTALLLLND